jgi:hypothetical protein
MAGRIFDFEEIVALSSECKRKVTVVERSYGIVME